MISIGGGSAPVAPSSAPVALSRVPAAPRNAPVLRLYAPALVSNRRQSLISQIRCCIEENKPPDLNTGFFNVATFGGL